MFCSFFWIKFRKIWHTARLSRTNRHKVIKSEKQSGFFWPTLYILSAQNMSSSDTSDDQKYFPKLVAAQSDGTDVPAWTTKVRVWKVRVRRRWLSGWNGRRRGRLASGSEAWSCSRGPARLRRRPRPALAPPGTAATRRRSGPSCGRPRSTPPRRRRRPTPRRSPWSATEATSTRNADDGLAAVTTDDERGRLDRSRHSTLSQPEHRRNNAVVDSGVNASSRLGGRALWADCPPAWLKRICGVL